MTKPLLVIAGFILSAICPSEKVLGQNISANTKIYNNQIKWSPFRVADPVNPGIELGYERLYAKDFSTQLSVGYMEDVFKTTPFTNYHGSRISLEQKYFYKKERRINHYIAFEVVRLNVNYADASTFAKDTSAKAPTYLDRHDVDKQTLAFNTKYGLHIPWRSFIIDITAGVGVKHRRVIRTGVDDPNAFEQKARHPNIYEMASEEANGWTVSVPVNIKIGYRF